MRRAVLCDAAAALQAAASTMGVDVRVGLHAGEIIERADDVSGVAVHIAARVAAIAKPREVLVTRTIKDLVAGAGLTFADRGEHTLKGIDEAWQLYAATA